MPSPQKKLALLGREIIEAPSATDDAIPFPDYLAFVPWKHHVEIVTKCKSVEEALFYVMKCINEGWSRHTFATLTLTYRADLYTISKLLGHCNIRTTRIYAKIVDENKRKAVNLVPKI